MYIYIEDRAIFNTEQIAEICVYKKTNAEWRLCAIIGGEECRCVKAVGLDRLVYCRMARIFDAVNGIICRKDVRKKILNRL